MVIIRIIILWGLIYIAKGTPKSDTNNKDDTKDTNKGDENGFHWGDGKNFMVKITNKSRFLCEGTIISVKWVMTAGNCMFVDDIKVSFNQVTVQTREATYKVTKREIHMLYQHSDVCDIAILRLGRKIKLTKKVHTVVLEKKLQESDLDYTDCRVISLRLKDPAGIKVLTITNADCKQEWLGYATQKDICGKSVTSKPIICSAYVGAPLFCKGRQVGIMAFGPKNCEAGIDVFTKVPEFTQWIWSYAV